jgi:hypothetical protein
VEKLQVVIKPERLLVIVRAPMRRLNGRGVLDVLKTDGPQPIDELVRMMTVLVHGTAPVRTRGRRLRVLRCGYRNHADVNQRRRPLTTQLAIVDD